MATFYWPTPGYTSVTSPFGQRTHPTTGQRDYHLGIDIGVPAGVPIHASRGGVVSKAQYSGTYGNMVLIQHGNSYQTRYAHLSKISVKAGDSVKSGDQVGLCGSTGRSTGPHLHFEVLKNGGAINPLTVVSPSNKSTWSVDVSGDTDSDATNASGESAVVHIPQTEKVYTLYLLDSVQKAVDVYQILWKAYEAKNYTDITDRCGSPSLKDDSASCCLEFEFSILQSTEKYLAPLKIECGDKISVINTGSTECIFSGQVEDISGSYRGSQTLRCLDGGRLLTCNAILLQCNNISAKSVAASVASKLGLSVNCPDLVSSVYEMYHDNASSILSGILETVESENGIPYFLRVTGNTLSVRSFGKTCLTAYCKLSDNISAFDVMAEPGNPTVGRSIADLRNSIVVYSEADDTATVQGAAEDDRSIARYGRRQALVTYSDKDTASANAKAKTNLAALNQVEETFSLSTYGSDRVTAGVRMKVSLDEISGEFWVSSVVHHLTLPHRMDITFRRCGD